MVVTWSSGITFNSDNPKSDPAEAFPFYKSSLKRTKITNKRPTLVGIIKKNVASKKWYFSTQPPSLLLETKYNLRPLLIFEHRMFGRQFWV